MASEEQANNVRRQYGRDLMKRGAHAIGVEPGSRHGKQGWVVVAHVTPDSKASMPNKLSCATKEGDIDVPVVTVRTEAFKPE